MTTREELDQALKSYWADRPVSRSIDCGEGWYDLIYNLHMDLVETDPYYQIHQIKEKFGGLRFYTGTLSDAGRELVNEAEAKSYTICELSGREGATMHKRKDGFWIRSLHPEVGEAKGYEPWSFDDD